MTDRPANPHRGRLIRSALAGGGLATVVFLATALGMGSVGDREALHVLESTLPTIRFLCSGAIGAAATVLALMLTLLGLSQDLDSRIHPDYFRRIQHIATLCVWVLIGAVGLLLILCVPLGESDTLATWYNVIYYGVLVLASLLGGALVAIILTLHVAVRALLAAAHPEASSRMTLDEDEVEEAGVGSSSPSEPVAAGE